VDVKGYIAGDGDTEYFLATWGAGIDLFFKF